MVFTVPINQAKPIVDFLHTNGLTNDDISVIGAESVPFDDLPDAGEYGDDVTPGAIRGAGVGAGTGLVIGLSAAIVGPGLVVGGAALALITAFGATFGVLSSVLIGSSVPNSQIREYEESLERGEVLLVAEIEDERVEELLAKLMLTFPDLDPKGHVQVLPPMV